MIEREEAEKIFQHAKELLPQLDRFNEALQSISDDRTRTEYVHAYMSICGKIYGDVILRIIREHPEYRELMSSVGILNGGSEPDV